MYSPAARVTKLKEIPFEKWEEVIVSTMAKDFSKKIKTSLIKKFRNAFHRRGTGLFGRI
jgi:hypothetical protein